MVAAGSFLLPTLQPWLPYHPFLSILVVSYQCSPCLLFSPFSSSYAYRCFLSHLPSFSILLTITFGITRFTACFCALENLTVASLRPGPTSTVAPMFQREKKEKKSASSEERYSPRENHVVLANWSSCTCLTSVIALIILKLQRPVLIPEGPAYRLTNAEHSTTPLPPPSHCICTLTLSRHHQTNNPELLKKKNPWGDFRISEVADNVMQ